MTLKDFIRLSYFVTNDINKEVITNTFISKEKFHFENNKISFDYRFACDLYEHKDYFDTKVNFSLSIVVDFENINETHKEKFLKNEKWIYNIKNGSYYIDRVFLLSNFNLKQKTKTLSTQEEEKYRVNKETIIENTFNQMLQKIPNIETKIKKCGKQDYGRIKYILFNEEN